MEDLRNSLAKYLCILILSFIFMSFLPDAITKLYDCVIQNLSREIFKSGLDINHFLHKQVEVYTTYFVSTLERCMMRDLPLPQGSMRQRDANTIPRTPPTSSPPSPCSTDVSTTTQAPLPISVRHDLQYHNAYNVINLTNCCENSSKNNYDTILRFKY